MSDDLYRERARRAIIRPTPDGLNRAGTPRRLGRVATINSLIAPGKFLKMNPTIISGTETEGGTSPSLVTDTSQSFIAALLRGPAQQGDYLVARFVDYRWVVEKDNPPSSTTPQPGCPCNPMPNTMAFAGNYATIFGPPGRDPTSLGCPTSTTLTAQTRPANFQHSSIVANNTVWMSPAFTYNYYTFDQNTGNYDILNTTNGAAIIYWCQPQTGQVTCQIYDGNNNWGAVNALLAQTGDTYTVTLACTPFYWKYNATTSAWTGQTILSA